MFRKKKFSPSNNMLAAEPDVSKRTEAAYLVKQKLVELPG
jgi:hypothetical protein